MSRSGYSEDHEGWASICWRGAVASATRGARGQALLKELLVALNAMEEKRLVVDSFTNDGVCALGALAAKQGLDLTELERSGNKRRAEMFGVAPALTREIMYENDEGAWVYETESQRYVRMCKWIDRQIIEKEGAQPC